MSRNARVLKSGKCEVTQSYKIGTHKGIDIVGEGYKLDDIVAHSAGTVVQVINTSTESTPDNPTNPGNMVRIDHGNGYQTRYLHLAANSVKVKVGDRVNKGKILGYMGDTGNAFGKHLHFEVLKDNQPINPTLYLENNLPNSSIVNVYYRVRTQKHGWLSEVKNLEDYAGYENSPITDVAIRVDKGNVKYRVHIRCGNTCR